MDNPTEQAKEKLLLWRAKPYAMVEDLFGVKPDPWQFKALEAFPHVPRLAMKACKGPGKTALLAWIGWNFLLTRPDSIVGATSISGDNLKTNLWTELSRWYNKAKMLQAAFQVYKTVIENRERPGTWKLEARTWAKDAAADQIGNALAGLHADFVMWLLDESGDYPDAIMPTAEGIFSGNPIEAHIVQAGNPTRLSGPLYRACTINRKFWHVVEITADPDDPDRTPRVSVEQARAQIEMWGRDSPWVLVNIFGHFPPSSLNSLIGPDAVSAAMKRFYRPMEIGRAPRIMGVDVARFGDDASVIAKRQGIQAFPFRKLRNVDSTFGAATTSREWEEFKAHACFVDNTGGYGSGWLDRLTELGRSPIGVGFSETAHEKSRFYNKRAEMYWDAVEWIKQGGALPEIPELLAALTETTYTFKTGRILLEEKDMVKAKLGYSPDDADAFVLTFAHPVTVPGAVRSIRKEPEEYNPYAEPTAPFDPRS